MIDDPLLENDLVRLVALDPKADADHLARWSHDSEFLRLFDSDPAKPQSRDQAQKRCLEIIASEHDHFFIVRERASDRPIGLTVLDGIEWSHGEGWFAIALGDRHYWGCGFGSAATQLMLRFAFQELNLYRISLTVFAYNERAIRTYQKFGFVTEGRARQFVHRDGQRWDMLFMGLLQPEWQALNA